MYHINDNLEYSLNEVSILDLIKISLDPFEGHHTKKIIDSCTSLFLRDRRFYKI